MKRLSYILAIILACGLLGCTQREIEYYPGYEGVSPQLVRELGLDEPEMPVRIGFLLPGEKPVDPSTRASIVGGEEDPADYIKTLHLVCFTKEGIYLGWRPASLIGAEQIYNHNGLNCQGRDLFEGTVPSRTARIHFVGNVGIGVQSGYAPPNIPGNDQIGGNENTLVKSSKMTVGVADRTICYWGFHGEQSSEDMKAWLALASIDPDTGSVTYSKKEGHNIHMVRDRAKVDFGYMFDSPRTSQDVEDGKTVTINGQSYTITGGKITIDGHQYPIQKNPTDYTIQKISWILSNGLSKGYIAPYYDENADDHFSGYYDPQATPALKEDRLTQYDKADATRYTATENDMMTIYENGMSVDNPLFLFEDENDEKNPPKIILKVVYQIDGQSGTKTKFHTLMMLNESQDPCTILRNHNYVLDIFGIPWEGLGYASFDDAVNSVTYANNQTVTISESVPAVNDGRYQLSIEGDTYLIFQDPSLQGTEQTVYFTYSSMVSGESTSDVHASDFKAAWTTDVRSSFASQNITVSEVSNNGTVFRGAITFTLGTSINSALQGGQIELRDKLTGMTRFINVYTIDQFNFLPGGSTPLALVPTGGSRTVNDVSCPTYKMDFCIPGDYPLGLYSVAVRMASITLNPFKVERRSSGDSTLEETVETIAVAMEGTENGTVLDKTEILDGMNFVTSPTTAWNYRASGEPWNFWFIYNIINKPSIDSNGISEEDTRDKIYTVYFDDIRQLRAAGNRADHIGLFFKIKYFGPAVAVSYQQ